MYTNNLHITIISSSTETENIISGILPPEDCLLNFSTADDITKAKTGDDCAVIIDLLKLPCSQSDIENKISAVRSQMHSVILISDGSISLPSSLLDSADDVWLIPSGSGLLQFHAAKLLDRMKESADYRKLKICFDTAFDSIPDLVWFKDVIGAHLMVNSGFCKAVEKTKEQIYKKGHYYIWDIPKEEYDMGDYVCLESESVVMDARKTCLFDEKVKTKNGMRQFKTYKSPLIDTNGEIFGTCGIAHDVTDLHNINNEMAILLESMPFGVMVEDHNGIAVSCNTKFCEYFPDYKEIVGSESVDWKKSYLGSEGYLSEAAELTLDHNGKSMVLSYRTEYVTDIFKEQIGKINILSDITPEHRSRQSAIHSANTDFLTSLHNRRGLFEHLNRRKDVQTMTLVMIDLDNFKKVNDNYGHRAGDKALVETARILKCCFSDDFIARIGGDEFIIVIEKNCTIDEIKQQADELQQSLHSCFAGIDEFKVMSASIGIAQDSLSENGTRNIENLIHCSDDALYTAKNSGKGRCCVYGN